MAQEKTYRTENGETYSRSIAVTKTKQVKGRLEDYDVDMFIEFTPTYTTTDPAVQAAIEEMGEFGEPGQGKRIVEQATNQTAVTTAQKTVAVGGASIGGHQVAVAAALPPQEPTSTLVYQQPETATALPPAPEEASVTQMSVDEAAAALIRDHGIDPTGLRDGTGYSGAAVAGAYAALGIPAEISHEGPALQRNHPASPPPNVAPLPDVTGTMAGPVGVVVADAAPAVIGTDPAAPVAGQVANSDGTAVTSDDTATATAPKTTRSSRK